MGMWLCIQADDDEEAGLPFLPTKTVAKINIKINYSSMKYFCKKQSVTLFVKHQLKEYFIV